MNNNRFFALFRNLRRKTPQKILINLCFSILFLVITFLVGIKRTSNSRVCHVVSSLLHYFTLTTFGWMVVECVFLYKSVVIVLKFHPDLKLFWTICILTWGTMLIIFYTVLSFVILIFFLPIFNTYYSQYIFNIRISCYCFWSDQLLYERSV